MRSNRWWGLLGWCKVRIAGVYPEKYINLAAARRLRMWDTVLGKNEVCFKTDLFSADKLAEICRRTGCSSEIVARGGLAVYAGYLRQRKILVVGFFCFWLLLWYASSLVWTVDIEGAEQVDRSEVLQLAADMGLSRWASLKDLDFNEIEQEIVIKFPQISWVAIDRRGTYVKIRIVEKEFDPLQGTAPIDIVAAHDGIIAKIMVLQGRAMVDPGMTVAKGDVLISGYRTEQGLVNAAGAVSAIIQLEGYGECPLIEVTRVPTGNSVNHYGLRLGKREYALSRRRHGFAQYDVEQDVRPLRWRWPDDVALVRVTYREIELQEVVYKADEARDIARERALLRVHQLLEREPDARIIARDVQELTLANEDIYRFRVRLEVETSIGREAIQGRED